MDNAQSESRPSVLDNASETQIQELEQQFSEGDREGWRTLVESYGWSNDQGEEVWRWFEQRPSRTG